MSMLGEGPRTVYTGGAPSIEKGRAVKATLASRDQGTLDMTIETMSKGRLDQITRSSGRTYTGGIVAFSESPLLNEPPAWIVYMDQVYEVSSVGGESDGPEDPMGYHEYEALLMSPQPAAS